MLIAFNLIAEGNSLSLSLFGLLLGIGRHLKVRVGIAAMFASIQALCLLFRGDPQTYGLVDQLEHDKGGAKSPDKASTDP